MKFKLGVFIFIILVSCKPVIESHELVKNNLMGNWQLISSEYIRPGKTIKNVTAGQKMIKIITDKYFAFLLHDVKEKDSTSKSIPVFSAGGGSYTLENNKYTEHLEYCSARNYEGNDIVFEIEMRSDTLILSGMEKVKQAGVSDENVKLVEKYIRIKD